MANPTTVPTTTVTSTISITLQDILSGIQAFSRITPPVSFEALQVQYQGNINLPVNSSPSNFTPFGSVTLWNVVYVRNIGPSPVFLVALNSSTGVSLVIDVGGMFLYTSPHLSSTVVSGTTPGFTGVGLATSTTTAANVEILLAG